jgi:hypothetical protein
MIELMVSREVVVGLAVLGALPSVFASTLQMRGYISAARARHLNFIGYGLMGLSMALFIVAGFRAR